MFLLHLLAFLTMTIWGTTFVATKLLLANGLTPAHVFLLRFSLAYIGLSLACIVRRRRSKREKGNKCEKWMCFSLRDELLMVVAGMTGGSFYFLTENTALQVAMASNVSLIVCLAPLITTILSLFIKNEEKASSRLWIGSLIAFMGVAFIVYGSETGKNSSNPVIGSFLALAAATLWAFYQHIVKPLCIRYGTWMLTRKVFGYGILTILPFVLGNTTFSWQQLADPIVWGNLLFLGLIASLLCYVVWNRVVSKLGSIVSANYIYLNPLVTCIASYFILGERLTAWMVLGGIFVLMGLYLSAVHEKGNKKEFFLHFQKQVEKEKDISHPVAIVYYRLPQADNFTQLIQKDDLKTYPSLACLSEGQNGYIIAPFQVSETCPIILVEPNTIHTFPLQEPTSYDFSVQNFDETEQRIAYARSFSSAHRRLECGDLEKEVLSRRLCISFSSNRNEKEENVDLLVERGKNLFFRACQMRPECFVSFWWTKQTGAWLVATPEPILQKQSNGWQTVALAGTTPLRKDGEPRWSQKNMKEQAVVAHFIKRTLNKFTSDISVSKTQTFATGNIQHLCTKFRFSLPNQSDAFRLLSELHPTPAVCGMPRKEAAQAIEEDEDSPRYYYAGFSGSLFLNGETQLFVSLRCMNFSLYRALLYAGGGIMIDSKEEDEWNETKHKLSTMIELLNNKGK